jgi:hypothetical protein
VYALVGTVKPSKHSMRFSSVRVVDRVKHSPGFVGGAKKDVERAVTTPETGRIRIFVGRKIGVFKAGLYTRYITAMADDNGSLCGSQCSRSMTYCPRFLRIDAYFTAWPAVAGAHL